MGVNSLPKTVTRQRRGCDLNPGPSVPESSTLSTRLPSHPCAVDLQIYAISVQCANGSAMSDFDNIPNRFRDGN